MRKTGPALRLKEMKPEMHWRVFQSHSLSLKNDDPGIMFTADLSIRLYALDLLQRRDLESPAG